MTDPKPFEVGNIVEFEHKELNGTEIVSKQYVRGEIVAIVDIFIGHQQAIIHAVVKAGNGNLYVKPTNGITHYRQTRAEILFDAYCVMFRDFQGNLPKWGDITPGDKRLLESLADTTKRRLDSISGDPNEPNH